MPKFECITLIIKSLPGARAQVQVNIPTPMPGMRLETPAHALAIDALGWLGKQPAVAGFVYGGQPHMPPQCLHQIAEPDTQKPFMWAIKEPGGSAYMDEGCVSSVREDVQAEVDGLNSGLDDEDDTYQVVPVYLTAPILGPLTQAARDVLSERQRQVEEEGYDPEYDDSHANDEIAAMAALFVMPEGARDWDARSTGYGQTLGEALLPPDWNFPRMSNRRDQLVKGTAMALAEIERIDRAAQKAQEQAA